MQSLSSWLAKEYSHLATRKKYLSMNQAEFERHSDNINRKGFKLERYTDFVVERFKKYQDTQAAQMHNQLKEYYPDFPAVSPKIVYNYVMTIRQEHGLPAVSHRSGNIFFSLNLM